MSETQTELVILSASDETIYVKLPHGDVRHSGSAVVRAGHLFLRGNPAHAPCTTSAIYAPGEWRFANLVKLVKEPEV